MTTNLELSGLTKHYGEVPALRGVDLEVHPGELLTLLGPSGSGKTTLLKVIAGFETAEGGCVSLAGLDITMLAPNKRDIGMVFQNYALFPHMSVAANVAFPLKIRKIARSEVALRVDEALQLVGLEGYGERLPKQLSGGQQQRVALARAVIFKPRLLLLDEPFGALDRKLREQMQLEVRRLQQRLEITTIFVTHDQEEALVLSDRIAVMSDGVIAQLGEPRSIYAKPLNRFVADFIGESNLLHARTSANGDRAVLDSGASVELPKRGHAGAEIGLLIRPESVGLARATSGDAGFGGTIEEVVYLGSALKYFLRLEDGSTIIARQSLGQFPALQKGEQVVVSWPPAAVHLVQW